MSTIEDKILDGPRIHYCDEADDVRSGEDLDENHTHSGNDNFSSLFVRPDEETERLERASHVNWRASSVNTGPKGVIEDYRKKKSLNNKPDQVDDLDAEFQNLLNDDSILEEFISKRISKDTKEDLPTFGYVRRLQTGVELLDAIDKEHKNVLVIVHLYTKYSRSCNNMNHHLHELATQLNHIKFVTLDASATALSGNFKENAVPALLAYRGGDLVKSLIQVDELMDKNFDSQQIKELLIDHNLTS